MSSKNIPTSSKSTPCTSPCGSVRLGIGQICSDCNFNNEYVKNKEERRQKIRSIIKS